ncbi:hypothetical protein VE01_02543 [Pseudogymnoascus verrucosus]|uniref:Uncharacterized protein n=1 Tax=Pseudogymnoascus verrucosus TaxID=342668 RepID=A0A1B8GU62_9PEZI|nr:uncharacterized protein VE01_02543 [Pseudogymnoascus verrucosus]OBT99384.2 hypothetical protein VE01_02543 [Pseudogymnoascus verrucosus]
MLQNHHSVRALITRHDQERTSFQSGVNNLARSFSKSIRLGRTSSQQDSTTTNTRMSPLRDSRRAARRSSLAPDGGEQHDTNGHTSTQPSNTTSRQRDDMSSAAEIETYIGPLTKELRAASQQLLNAEKAVKAVSDSCIQYADEITQIPLVQKRFEELRGQIVDKDATISNQKIALDVLEQRASDKEQAAKSEVAANRAEKERLQSEKEDILRQREADDEKLRAREEKLRVEAVNELSRLKGVQDREFIAQRKILERDLEKKEKEQAGKVRKLEATSKKALDTINELKLQVETQRNELIVMAGKFEDLDKAKDMYKMEKEQLAMKLEDLQKEFSLSSKPLEYYNGEFLKISTKIQAISSQYLARKLSNEEMRNLPAKISASDSAFTSVPLSNSETSLQLRTAHAQRVISDAVYNTVWRHFSSDITSDDLRLSTFIEKMGSAVAKSDGSGRSADVWRAVTVRTLESLSTTETRRQEGILQEAGTAKSFKCREDKLVNLVLSILGSLVDPPSLPQFKADLLDIARDAISVWTSAQSDERTFTINSTLNQENKRDWNVAALDYDSLYADGGPQQVVESKPFTEVFTLFPIIIATKRVQAPKAATGPPGSWPEQDQQALGKEVTLIHNGLGLPQESEMVQRGIEEVEDKKRLRLELDELLVQEMAEKGRGHSRNNSTVVTASGPSSPIQRWSENRRNGHPTEI